MEVDRLEIAIRADAGKANAQLKILIGNYRKNKTVNPPGCR